MSLQSTITLAKKKQGKTLRVVIPQGIVAFLNLKPGDKLDWNMQVLGPDGERYVAVKKAKKN